MFLTIMNIGKNVKYIHLLSNYISYFYVNNNLYKSKYKIKMKQNRNPNYQQNKSNNIQQTMFKLPLPLLPLDIVNDILEYNADHRPLMQSLMSELMATYMGRHVYELNIQTLYQTGVYLQKPYSVTIGCVSIDNQHLKKYDINNTIKTGLCCIYCEHKCSHIFHDKQTINVRFMTNTINSASDYICERCSEEIKKYEEDAYYEDMLFALEDDELEAHEIRYFRNHRI